MEHKVFKVYVVALNIDKDDEMHSSKKAQIAQLKANKALTKIPGEYADFADVFSPKLTAELSEYTGIKDHTIE